jgi:hypothetical protein
MMAMISAPMEAVWLCNTQQIRRRMNASAAQIGCRRRMVVSALETPFVRVGSLRYAAMLTGLVSE